MFGVRTGDRDLKRAVDLAGGGGAGRLSRRRFVPGAAAGISALSVPGLLALPGDGAAASAQAAALQPETLHRRVRAELARFTGWLQDNAVDGKVGWPDDYAGDTDHWNALAEAWYADADEANLRVTQWSTGERRGTGYKLAPCEDRHFPGDSPNGVDPAATQAAVSEAHPQRPSYLRGVVNVSGTGFGAPFSTEPTSSFSNRRLGRYDRAYHYGGQATFAHLAGGGSGWSGSSSGGSAFSPNAGARSTPRSWAGSGRRSDAPRGLLAGPARNGPRPITKNTGRGR